MSRQWGGACYLFFSEIRSPQTIEKANINASAPINKIQLYPWLNAPSRHPSREGPYLLGNSSHPPTPVSESRPDLLDDIKHSHQHLLPVASSDLLLFIQCFSFSAREGKRVSTRGLNARIDGSALSRLVKYPNLRQAHFRRLATLCNLSPSLFSCPQPPTPGSFHGNQIIDWFEQFLLSSHFLW